MENNKVYILLATYNGEKYIDQQIKSIINQTFTNWKLIIRDDGSDDNTISIIKALALNEKRIELINDEVKNLGAFANFYSLTKYTNKQYNPHYVLYSDQDDFWYKHKIEILVQTIKYYENKESPMPILVHSNYQLADQNLNPLSIKVERDDTAKMINQSTFNKLIFQNNIYGCTTIANQLMIKKSLEGNLFFENHDHWMSLNAAWFGKIFYLNEKLMLYRQHNSNVTGSYITRKSLFKKILSINSELKKESLNILKNIINLDFFLKTVKYSPFVSKENSTIKKIESKKILWFCLRNRITKNTVHETLFFYLSLYYSAITNFKSAKRKIDKRFLY